MRNPIGIISAGLLVVAVAARAKGSAESAIAAAEKAVTGIQSEAAKVAPGELKALTDSIAAMKEHVAAGNHRAALMGAGVSRPARAISDRPWRPGRINSPPASRHSATTCPPS